MASYQTLPSDASDAEIAAQAALFLATNILQRLSGSLLDPVAVERIFEGAMAVSVPRPGTATHHMLSQFLGDEAKARQAKMEAEARPPAQQL